MRPASVLRLFPVLFALATPLAAQEGGEPALSAVAQAAAQRGIVTCLPAIDTLAKSLAESYDLGVFIFNQIDSPDEGLISISMELASSPSGGPVYVSASFISTAGGGCQVLVEATMHWDANCTTVGLAYPGYRVAGRLLNQIGILAAQGTERLFLIPSPSNACISVEKSIYF